MNHAVQLVCFLYDDIMILTAEGKLVAKKFLVVLGGGRIVLAYLRFDFLYDIGSDRNHVVEIKNGDQFSI